MDGGEIAGGPSGCGIHLLMQVETWGFDPWVRKTPWSRKWQPAPVFLPEESMDRGALRAAVPVAAKSQTRLK